MKRKLEAPQGRVEADQLCFGHDLNGGRTLCH